MPMQTGRLPLLISPSTPLNGAKKPCETPSRQVLIPPQPPFTHVETDRSARKTEGHGAGARGETPTIHREGLNLTSTANP